MVLPIDSPYPVTTNPVVFRALAALPAVGAWDAAPIEIASAGLRYLTLYQVYTRGGVAGAADFQIFGSPYPADIPGVMSWFSFSLKSNGILAAGTDVISFVQREIITYTATGAGAESFTFGAIDLGHTVERLYVRARESGNAGAPGTLGIIGVFNRGS